MNIDGSKILITGAAGFVGQHLAPVLVAHGVRIRGTTRRISNVNHEIESIEWVSVGEIGPKTDWKETLHGVDTVIHLAALAHQTDPRHQPNEAEFMAVNADGTRRLAEAALRSGGVRRFVFVSSIGSVAESSENLVDENTPARPVSPYGRSKLAGEQAVKEVFDGSVMEWCVLRPVLVYGPGNPGNMARLLRLVKSQVPLPLDGIKNRRSFVFVGNLVDAIECAAFTPGLSGRVFHVADDEAVSTPDLIREIGIAAGQRVRLWPAPRWSLGLAARGGDLAARLGVRTGLDTYSLRRLESSLTVSIEALKTASGWRPRVSLADGLRATLKADDISGV
jgi:nucleoside-diphosphate-sugar epimerase